MIVRTLIASITLLACFSNAVVAAEDVQTAPELATQHTSIFNKIRYRIPKGWVVWDGMSDWVAPSNDKQFWETGFDASTDAYYVVSAIFPFLTMDDMQKKRVRSLEDIVEVTLHSLEVAAKAKQLGDVEFFELNGNRAAGFLVTMDGTQSHYQILVAIADDEVATVAGNGPHAQRSDIQALVKAIAATIKPGKTKSYGGV